MGSIWYSFGPLSQFCSRSNQHPLHKIAKAFGVMFFLLLFFSFSLDQGQIGWDYLAMANLVLHNGDNISMWLGRKGRGKWLKEKKIYVGGVFQQIQKNSPFQIEKKKKDKKWSWEEKYNIITTFLFFYFR